MFLYSWVRFEKIVFSNWRDFFCSSFYISSISVFRFLREGFVKGSFLGFCFVCHGAWGLFPFKDDFFHHCNSFLFVELASPVCIPVDQFTVFDWVWNFLLFNHELVDVSLVLLFWEKTSFTRRKSDAVSAFRNRIIWNSKVRFNRLV